MKHVLDYVKEIFLLCLYCFRDDWVPPGTSPEMGAELIVRSLVLARAVAEPVPEPVLI